MTESKEWVTIKIPESIRDKAKGDPRTYGQIMQAGLENEPFVTEGDVEVEPIVDYEEMAEIIGENLERDVDLSPVLNRLDDLQSQLPNDVKEELR